MYIFICMTLINDSRYHYYLQLRKMKASGQLGWSCGRHNPMFRPRILIQLAILIFSLRLMNIPVSKLFSGVCNSLIFELTRLIFAHFICWGTALSSRSMCPGWPRPHATTAQRKHYFCLSSRIHIMQIITTNSRSGRPKCQESAQQTRKCRFLGAIISYTMRIDYFSAMEVRRQSVLR